MDVLGRIARAISDALCDPEKLPEALILCDILEAGAALSLIFWVPGGVFLHHGDKAFVYTYYIVLVAAVVFGIPRRSRGSGCQWNRPRGAPSGGDRVVVLHSACHHSCRV